MGVTFSQWEDHPDENQTAFAVPFQSSQVLDAAERLTRREKIKKQVRRQQRLATIRRIPDDLWGLIRPLLPPEKPAGTVGRLIVLYRTVLDGILHVLRTGCQWKMVSKEFGSGSTCHKRFQEWVASGVFLKAWQLLPRRYDELRGIQWMWQAVDSKSVPAPLGGEDTGPNPTDRSKSGSKRHQLADGRGVPLSAEVTAANATDMKTNPAVLDGIVVRRPRPTRQNPQHLCEDKGYDYPECREQAQARATRCIFPTRGLTPAKCQRAKNVIRPAGGLSNVPTPGRTVCASCAHVGRRKPRTGKPCGISRIASPFTE